MAKRYLQIYRDGKAKKPVLLQIPLMDGEQGNFQTLEVMKKIVLADRLKADLRRLVLRDVIGADVEGHNFAGEIEKIFRFAQKNIIYRKDAVQTERITDLWTTLFGLENEAEYTPEGDCGIKSLFAATCLALLGHKPVFIIITQKPDAKNFSHIYNGVIIDGEIKVFDATPEEKPFGYEPKSFKKFIIPIFD